MLKRRFSILATVVIALGAASADASVYLWTDWQTSSSPGGTTFVGQGVITTTTSMVNVTYTNTNGISFYQTGGPGDTDYWQNGPGAGGRDPSDSPYTSAQVENIPTGTDMIALQFAGTQTLAFSQAIANPVFSYVSLNGNGYAFDQDFEILSFGDASNGNDPGYWGSGTSFKQVVDLGGGNFEYQLLGTGEPHGTIRFLGAFDTVNWRSLSNETWNGFTVGIEGTASEVFPPTPTDPGSVPEPAAIAVWGLLGSMAAVVLCRRSLRRTA